MKKAKAKWPQIGYAPIYADGDVGTVYRSKRDAVYFSGFAGPLVIKVEIRLAKKKAKR